MTGRTKTNSRIAGAFALVIAGFLLTGGGLPSAAFAQPNSTSSFASVEGENHPTEAVTSPNADADTDTGTDTTPDAAPATEPEPGMATASGPDSEAILLGVHQHGDESVALVAHPASLNPVIYADDELQLAACSPIGRNNCNNDRVPPRPSATGLLNESEDEEQGVHRVPLLYCDGKFVPPVECGDISKLRSLAEDESAVEEQGVTKRPPMPWQGRCGGAIPSSWCTKPAESTPTASLSEDQESVVDAALPEGCDAMFAPGAGPFPAVSGKVCTHLQWVSLPDASELQLNGLFDEAAFDPAQQAMEILVVTDTREDTPQDFDHNELLCLAPGDPASADPMQVTDCPSELIAALDDASDRQTEQYAYTVEMESGQSMVWDTCWLSHPDEVTGSADQCGESTESADSTPAAITPAVAIGSTPATSTGSAPTQRPERVTGTVEVRVNGDTVVASAPVQGGRAQIETAALDPGFAHYEFVFLSANDEIPDSSFTVTALITEAPPTPGGSAGMQVFWGALLVIAAMGAVVLLVGRPNLPAHGSTGRRHP